MKSKRETPTSSQSGNIIFIILIAVALFAALSFVVSQMMRGPTTIGEEKDGVIVAEILAYAQTMRNAVDHVMITGPCTDAQVSFERQPFDGSDPLYTNPFSPADFSCHVFHPDGGGAVDLPQPYGAAVFDYFYIATIGVSDIGVSGEPEILMVLGDISDSQCTIINERLGLGAPQTEATPVIAAFGGWAAGAFALAEGIGSKLGVGDAMYDGKPAGCFYNVDVVPAGAYFFYQVLLAR